MFAYKKLDLLLLKNTMMSVLPFILVLAFILGGMAYFNVFKNLECETVDSLQQLETAYKNDRYNIEITLDRLDNLGYDYYLDGKKSGSYYYTFMDDTCLILLIGSNEDVLYNYTVRGRVKLDNTLYYYILEQCAKDMGMTREQLQSFTYDYVLSEIEYPELFNNIVKIALVFVILITLYIVLQGVIWTLMPWKHPQIRKLHGIMDTERTVSDVNRQIHDFLKLKEGNVIITKRYLIVSSLFKTDIMRLRDIGSCHKHIVKKRSFPWIQTKDRYKLILSNSVDMYYEYEFLDEELVDKMIPFLERKKQLPSNINSNRNSNSNKKEAAVDQKANQN